MGFEDMTSAPRNRPLAIRRIVLSANGLSREKMLGHV